MPIKHDMKRCNPNEERISIVIRAIMTMIGNVGNIDNSDILIKHGTVSYGL